MWFKNDKFCIRVIKSFGGILEEGYYFCLGRMEEGLRKLLWMIDIWIEFLGMI